MLSFASIVSGKSGLNLDRKRGEGGKAIFSGLKIADFPETLDPTPSIIYAKSISLSAAYGTYVSFPNTFGDEDNHNILTDTMIMWSMAEEDGGKKCHRDIEHILCLLFYPQCHNPTTSNGSVNTKLPILHDNLTTERTFNETPNFSINKDTWNITATSLVTICQKSCFKVLKECKDRLPVRIFNIITGCCTYFPDSSKNSVCLDFNVTCEMPPPKVANGRVIGFSGDNNSNTCSEGSKVTYKCSTGYNMTGSENVTCESTGDWSDLPNCINNNIETSEKSSMQKALHNKWQIAILVALLLGFMTLAVCCCSRKSKNKVKNLPLDPLPTYNAHCLLSSDQNICSEINQRLAETQTISNSTINTAEPVVKRNKEYDAFVVYSCEKPSKTNDYPISPDEQFFEENILPKFDHSKGGRYKLFFHRRDFIAGIPITDNIIRAVQSSNTAIILISQDFINSQWCCDEFEICMAEHSKDPAFKMFAILMQPKETLTGIPIHMERFLRNVSYLQKGDVNLWQKLDQRLAETKSDNA